MIFLSNHNKILSCSGVDDSTDVTCETNCSNKIKLTIEIIIRN